MRNNENMPFGGGRESFSNGIFNEVGACSRKVENLRGGSDFFGDSGDGGSTPIDQK